MRRPILEERTSVKKIVFIELPTLPKGFYSLSLPTVAGALAQYLSVEIIDLNINTLERVPLTLWSDVSYFGLKVSSQNFQVAIQTTEWLRGNFPDAQILWGGELPTLQPDLVAKYADTVISGRIESLYHQLGQDLIKNTLQKKYTGGQSSEFIQPLWPEKGQQVKYKRFMGIPLETSRGCVRKCTFCLVHTMQPSIDFKSREQIRRELSSYTGNMVYVIDYNVGMNKDHLLMLADEIKESSVLGWSGEMCLESLDDDEILLALQHSRCKIIYCGLESVESAELRSVNKAKTNTVTDYQRIISKVQSYGIHLAAGVIWGLPGSTEESVLQTCRLFQKWGLHYVKFTFLTYNPGTKIKQSMEKMGRFITDAIEEFDGNHVTFIPRGSSYNQIMNATRSTFDYYYSWKSILARSWRASGFLGKLERFLFNTCYKYSSDHLASDVVGSSESSYSELLVKPYNKNVVERFAESLLYLVWRLQKKKKMGILPGSKAMTFAKLRRGMGLFLILAFVVLCVRYSFADQLPEPILLTAEMLKTNPRGLQVMECAKCHQKQFDNWLKGPHANSFIMWNNYNSNLHLEDKYTPMFSKLGKIHETRMKCLYCHAGPNVEDVLHEKLAKSAHTKVTDRLVLSAWTGSFSKEFDRPFQQSGTDCLSCHVRNNEVLVDPQRNSSGQYGNWRHVVEKTHYSQPKNTCIACHVTTMHMQSELKKEGNNQCLNCHGQKDKDGKFTHYFYWHLNKNKADQPPSPRYGIFELLSVQSPRKNNENAMLEWRLSQVAHAGTECNEMVLKVDVYDNKDRIVFEHKIRLNNRQEMIETFNRSTMKYFNQVNPPVGEEGFAFGPNTKDVKFPIPLNKIRDHGVIRLHAILKERFWWPDEGDMIFSKEFIVTKDKSAVSIMQKNGGVK